MKNSVVVGKLTMRHILVTVRVAALVVAFMVARPQAAQAVKIKPPSVPENIQVEAGNEVFLVGHAVGTQNYICLPKSDGTGVAYALFTPQATLFKDNELTKQIITHFFSPNLNPNPLEPEGVGAIRAAWQDSQDTSIVWGRAVPGDSAPAPVPGAIPWLLVTVVGAQDGPDGGDTLSSTTFIQRLNTTGGAAPSTGCSLLTDVGHQEFVPYTADYFFYQASDSQ